MTTPDFSLSATPASQTVTPGNGTSYALTLTPSNGFASNVSLSLGALPAGVPVPLSQALSKKTAQIVGNTPPTTRWQIARIETLPIQGEDSLLRTIRICNVIIHLIY